MASSWCAGSQTPLHPEQSSARISHCVGSAKTGLRLPHEVGETRSSGCSIAEGVAWGLGWGRWGLAFSGGAFRFEVVSRQGALSAVLRSGGQCSLLSHCVGEAKTGLRDSPVWPGGGCVDLWV